MNSFVKDHDKMTKVKWKIPKEYYAYFENLYVKNQDVRVSIDVMVDNIVGGGFEIVPSGEGQEEMVEELKEFSKRIELPRLNFEIVKNMLVYGNAFFETVMKKGKGIIEVKSHQPQTIGIVTDSSGKIIEYVKVKDNKVVKRFKVEEIAHFSNEPKSGPFGRSQIEFLVPVLKKEMKLKKIPEL